MKALPLLQLAIPLIVISSCTEQKQHYNDGFSISPETETIEENEINGIAQDSIGILTRPSSVLLTAYSDYRLTTIYKLNYDKTEDHYYAGSNRFYRNYSELGHTKDNNWNYNFMPGLQAVYGYNLVNASLKHVKTQKQHSLFEKPVLIKTLYIPSFSKDTLFSTPIKRDYYMISAYDEDTNKDGFINANDLRRFYVFNINGTHKESLIPKEYSVVSSEYDAANDRMYVFAQRDENNNGQREETEQVHVFWIDLKNPRNNGRQYE